MKLRLIEPPPWLDPPAEITRPALVSHDDGKTTVTADVTIRTHRLMLPGDCWYATRAPDGWYMFAEGPEPRRCVKLAPEHAKVRPMLVVLPNDELFCLHNPTLSKSGWGSSGWTVTGDLPNVTVKPSIHITGPFGWHGWLRNGELVTC